ncbi:MAG: hypothetical protein AB7V58_16970 [Solirubrobacterales bacterium]
MRGFLGMLLAALLVVLLPATARGDLGGLHLDGPPGAWRATNIFHAEWSEFTNSPVGYRFLNAAWDTGIHWKSVNTQLEITIPAPPGASVPPPGEYLVEMWVWSNGVNNPPGPSSYLALRFDASAPGAPQPTVPSAWIDSRSQAMVAIGAPAYVPPSGIRGYAVSVSPSRDEPPCALAVFCTDPELDLPGGPGQRQLTVGPLLEGTSYVNVVAVSGTGISSPVSSVPLQVDASPPAIRLAGVPAGWIGHPVIVTALAEDRASGTAAAGPNGPFTALAIDGGPPNFALGGAVAATVQGEGTHLLTAWARDRLGNAIGPEATPPATIRIDESPPQIAFAAAQQPDDPELIEVAVADPLSGPSADRGSIEVRPAGTSQAFEPLPTKATAAGLRARWSSDDYPPGSYEFRAIGFDAVGNRAVSERRESGAAMVLRNPVKVPTAIDSGFGGARLVWQHCRRIDRERRRCRRETVTDLESRPASRTVAYGRPLRFGGLLRNDAGAPLAGLPVEIVETFAAGADVAQRRTTVTSRGDGRFDARLAPGPSRRVEAFFAGNRTLTRSGGRQVSMAVRAGVRFEASTSAARIGGEPVIFSGRLRAGEATIRRTGRPIELEFRIPGGAWSEFRTIQTDRHGRFRYPYAFTDDDSHGIRFQFRAVSPEQADFPYHPAASAPVAVTGY